MMRARRQIERVLPRQAAKPDAGAALNLGEVDPPVWRVMSRDKAHGPFTLGQLQAFADGGRISPATAVAAGDGEPFLPASSFPQLRSRITAFAASRLTRQAAASNFVIISGPDANPAKRLAVSAALKALGPFAEPLPGTFVLRADLALSDVRRVLTSTTPEGTQLLIFESQDARLGWAGLSMQGAGELRAVWDAPVPPPAD